MVAAATDVEVGALSAPLVAGTIGGAADESMMTMGDTAGNF